jgi:hypothetical protein
MRQFNFLITEALKSSDSRLLGWICIGTGLSMVVAICIMCYNSSKKNVKPRPVENEELFNHLFTKSA